MILSDATLSQEMKERLAAFSYLFGPTPPKGMNWKEYSSEAFFSKTKKELIGFIERYLSAIAYSKGVGDPSNPFYEQETEEGKLGEFGQKLLKWSPPIVNPAFKDIPYSKLPDKVLEQYKDLMGIEDRGDFYALSKKVNIERNTRRLQGQPFIGRIKEEAKISDESFLSKIGRNNGGDEETLLGFERNLPTYLYKGLFIRSNDNTYVYEHIFKDVRNLSNIYNDVIFRREFKKEDFNHDLFMVYYYIAYHNFILNEFYDEYHTFIEEIQRISFVRKGKGDYSYEELAEMPFFGELLKHFVGIAYYEEKARIAKENKPKDTLPKLTDFDFAIGETEGDSVYFSVNMLDMPSQLQKAESLDRTGFNWGWLDNLSDSIKEADSPVMRRIVERIEFFFGITEENREHLEYLENYMSVVDSINQAHNDYQIRLRETVHNRWLLNEEDIEKQLDAKLELYKSEIKELEETWNAINERMVD